MERVIDTPSGFEIPNNSKVTIKINDISGRHVCELVDQKFLTGSYQEVWDGKKKYQNSVASGVYFIKFQTNDFVKVKNLIILR